MEGLLLPLEGGCEGGKVVLGSLPLRPFVEFASTAPELLEDPILPTLLSALRDGLQPAIKECSVLLGRMPGGAKNVSKVRHLWNVGMALFENEETVMLSDAKPKSAEMHVGADSLPSSLGPGNALAGKLQGGSASLITFGVHSCGAQK